MKYQVNPQFVRTEDLIIDVQARFADSQHVLHDARNKIKRVAYDGAFYAVKSFKQPSGLKQLWYSFFRTSKAQRSYNYSLKIANFVPQAIGYVEIYEGKLITSSFFVSELFDYDFTIREVLVNGDHADRAEIFSQFAVFTYRIHEQEILHKDYSPGNILIKQTADGYQFKIIDINRMQFKQLSIEARMRNFCMLWATDDDLANIITKYAAVAAADVDKCQRLARHFNQRNKQFKNFKKRIKGNAVTD